MMRTEIKHLIRSTATMADMTENQQRAVEQGMLRTRIVRDGNLIRASVMQEAWYEDNAPVLDVALHRPRELKRDLPELERVSFYSQFTRLYSPF